VTRLLFLTSGFVALYLTTFEARMFVPDETQRFDLAVGLARDGAGAFRHSGDVSRYPPLLSFTAAAPARLGRWLDRGRDDGPWVHRTVLATNVLLTALLVPVFMLAASMLKLDARHATLAALVFGLTNPLWPYSKHFYSEPLSALLVLSALVAMLRCLEAGGRPALATTLGCLVLLPLNNFVAALAVASGLCVMAILERRWKLCVAVVTTAAVGAMLELSALYEQFGGIAGGGYENERFTFPIREALHGFLIGPGRSVFLFAPMSALAVVGFARLVHRARSFAFGVLTTVVVTFSIVCCWWCWSGGVCWGPRLLLPVLPLAACGAIPLFETSEPLVRGAIVTAAVAGCAVQLLGCSYPQDYDLYRWMNPGEGDVEAAWFDGQIRSDCRSVIGPETARKVFETIRRLPADSDCRFDGTRAEGSVLLLRWSGRDGGLPPVRLIPRECAIGASEMTAASGHFILHIPRELRTACPRADAALQDLGSTLGAQSPGSGIFQHRPVSGSIFRLALGLLALPLLAVAWRMSDRRAH
jgi:hypothetical protein